MDSGDLTLGIFFLSQTCVGILGNFSRLFLYTFTFCTGYRLRTSDHILKHVYLANSLVLLCKGVPHILISFGLKNFLEDIGCKFLFYIHRVAREVCLSSTCFLSIFQAITVIPNKSTWAELKVRIQKYVGHFCFLFWVVHLLGNVLVALKVTGPRKRKNISLNYFGYCSRAVLNPINSSLFAFLHASIDVMCLGLLAWTSISMVLFLYRHKHQVRYIHSSRQISNLSPEIKATRNILILVCTFVFFSTLSSISSTYITMFNFPSWWLLNANVFLDACFPTFSPFVLIKSRIHPFRFCFVFC
ncbi:PREDICTED: vomeronasal type-1 receptor 3-like [Galeopterus variegatus]|uniref:Vomeronasal type-1 receptor n=1 Tax=Galeopterus variegatus TaxID=482537 RepID=A0ABM0QVB1_GALVR|nr:PREDICTED: vomeronasal type-1 receptor 3-like [Galeopterus variegatus]